MVFHYPGFFHEWDREIGPLLRLAHVDGVEIGTVQWQIRDFHTRINCLSCGPGQAEQTSRGFFTDA